MDFRIRYSHKHPTGDQFYNVYVNETKIGILTNMLSSGYRFEPDRIYGELTTRTYSGLNSAIRLLPSIITTELAQIGLSYMRNK